MKKALATLNLNPLRFGLAAEFGDCLAVSPTRVQVALTVKSNGSGSVAIEVAVLLDGERVGPHETNLCARRLSEVLSEVELIVKEPVTLHLQYSFNKPV